MKLSHWHNVKKTLRNIQYTVYSLQNAEHTAHGTFIQVYIYICYTTHPHNITYVTQSMRQVCESYHIRLLIHLFCSELILILFSKGTFSKRTWETGCAVVLSIAPLTIPIPIVLLWITEFSRIQTKRSDHSINAPLKDDLLLIKTVCSLSGQSGRQLNCCNSP